jgi:broad specificity phosphatase PhoE
MLVLVRHGESEGNAAGLLLGRAESPLTERGRNQAQAVAASLSDVHRLVSSPLSRALDTATALAGDRSVTVEVDERWVEVDYGEYDASPLGDVPHEVWQRWRHDVHHRPPGGESLAEVGARVRAACEELFAEEGAGAREVTGDVVVVSHVSPIKAAVAWALGADDLLAWRLYLGTAAVTRIGWGQGGPVLRAYNIEPAG